MHVSLMRFAFVTLMLGGALLSTACTKSDAEPDGTSGSDAPEDAIRVTVKKGGEVKSPDGKLTVSISPNAVEESIEVWLEEVPKRERPEGIEVLGTVYRLEPAGVNFDPPALAVFDLDDETKEPPIVVAALVEEETITPLDTTMEVGARDLLSAAAAIPRAGIVALNVAAGRAVVDFGDERQQVNVPWEGAVGIEWTGETYNEAGAHVDGWDVDAFEVEVTHLAAAPVTPLGMDDPPETPYGMSPGGEPFRAVFGSPKTLRPNTYTELPPPSWECEKAGVGAVRVFIDVRLKTRGRNGELSEFLGQRSDEQSKAVDCVADEIGDDDADDDSARDDDDLGDDDSGDDDDDADDDGSDDDGSDDDGSDDDGSDDDGADDDDADDDADDDGEEELGYVWVLVEDLSTSTGSPNPGLDVAGVQVDRGRRTQYPVPGSAACEQATPSTEHNDCSAIESDAPLCTDPGGFLAMGGEGSTATVTFPAPLEPGGFVEAFECGQLDTADEYNFDIGFSFLPPAPAEPIEVPAEDRSPGYRIANIPDDIPEGVVDVRVHDREIVTSEIAPGTNLRAVTVTYPARTENILPSMLSCQGHEGGSNEHTDCSAADATSFDECVTAESFVALQGGWLIARTDQPLQPGDVIKVLECGTLPDDIDGDFRVSVGISGNIDGPWVELQDASRVMSFLVDNPQTWIEGTVPQLP